MEFCGKCGGIMSVQNNRSACAACGAKTSKKIKVQASETVEKRNQIAVINEDASTTYPEVDMTCKKCKHKK
ncbi:hypothetical protein CMI48_04295, partial [Candidatus Pacearchaeota archaeon]|nr:hypothetical protein [Candidatus Pacearchaeota archaeon]